MKDDWNAYQWRMVTDKQGRPRGYVRAPSMMVQDEMRIVRDFLTTIQKGRQEEMTTQVKKTEEQTNMVFLAGKLKFDPKIFPDNIRALIDVGQKSAIQVSVYLGEKSNRDLGDKLKRFKEGDYIKLVAILRAYGIKQEDGTWKNNMSVDVTEIKNEPPQRSQPKAQYDDDVPY